MSTPRLLATAYPDPVGCSFAYACHSRCRRCFVQRVEKLRRDLESAKKQHEQVFEYACWVCIIVFVLVRAPGPM